jgi:O-antigen ligase
MASAALPHHEIAAVSSRKRRPAILDQIIFYGPVGLLLFGPVAFGATEDWAIFLLEFGAILLFVLWACKQARAAQMSVTSNPLFRPMLAFAGLALLQLLAGTSAYTQATLSATLLYGAYGILCFLVIQGFRRASQARNLAVIFSVYGTAIAFFALIQGITPNGKIYWLREPHLGGWIYGPYVNHNHYAGLMEMLFPIPLVFCFTRYAWGTRRRLAAFSATLMVSTVFLCGSRGGMLAASLQLVVLATILLNGQKSRKAALTLAAFVVLLTGILAWIGGGELVRRMASIDGEAKAELSGGVRLAIDRDALRMALKRPAVGWGLGTFKTVYPQFRSFYSNFFVNAAHNDYLQLLAETGVLGFAIMIWFLLALWRRSNKKLANWSANVNGAVTLGALIGCLGILIHSFVDFNLQIPANAALFYGLCVVAASEPLVESTRRRRSTTAEVSMSAPAV